MGFLSKPQNCEKKHRKLRFLLANMEMEKKKIKIWRGYLRKCEKQCLNKLWIKGVLVFMSVGE